MLDYHSHIAALNVMGSELSKSLGPSPHPQLTILERALSSEPSYAALGAIVDRLFEHLDDSDAEISLLYKASGIWQDITQYIARVAFIRTELEALVMDPSQSDALSRFNAISNEFQQTLKPRFFAITQNLQAYFDDVKLLGHVTGHGQEQDKPVDQWSWRDVVLSRRTGALMANLVVHARRDGSEQALAFAFGALASYASNVTGSAYLNQTVGGPRRAHRIRDRVASYAAGAWLLANHANLTYPIDELRNRILFNSPFAPTLPQRVLQIVTNAITDTYGANFGPPPDLDSAYIKLLRHLELLSAFVPPAMPEPIYNTLWARLQSMNPQSQNSGGPAPQNPGDPQPSQGSGGSDTPWYVWVLFAVCVALVAVCYLAGWCSPATKDPYPSPFQDSKPLQSYLASDEALVSVNTMFNLHVQLYQAATYCLKIMKLLGILYPDALDIGEPQFAQFTAVGSAPLLAFHRHESNLHRFLIWPTSPPESPVAQIAPFPIGATPIAFLIGSDHLAVNHYGWNLWKMEAIDSADSDVRNVNRNLDADRGLRHECWQVAAGSSIDTDPLNVQLLGYGEI